MSEDAALGSEVPSRSKPGISFRSSIPMVASFIAVGVFTIFLTVWSLRSDAIDDASDDVGNIATLLAEQTARSVQTIDLILREVQTHVRTLGVASPDEFRKLMGSEDVFGFLRERLVRLPQADVITIADDQGSVVNLTRSWPSPAIDLSDRELFQYFSKTTNDRLYVGKPVTSRVSGKQILFFSKRIDGSKREFLGIVLVGLELTYFKNIYESISSLPGLALEFVRTDGVLLVRHPEADAAHTSHLQSSLPWHDVVAKGGGRYRVTGARNEGARLGAAHPVGTYPLFVNVTVSEAGALANWLHRAAYIVLAALLVVVCAVFLILALTKQLRLLTASEKRLAQRSFELGEANIRLDAALNNMTQGLCFFDGRQRLIVSNRRFGEMYGLPADAVRPGTTLDEILHHRVWAGSCPAIGTPAFDGTSSLASPNEAASDFVEELQNGLVFAIRQRPLPDGGWVATHEDITDRVRADQKARAAHDRLIDAFAVVPEGLVYFDSDDRFVIWNNSYEEIYSDSKDLLVRGARFKDVLRSGIGRGQYPDAVGREDEWLDEQVRRHSQFDCPHEQQLPNGRWVRAEERRTSNGGSIGVRIDITELKRKEASFRLLFMSNPMPMWVYDKETLRFLAVNDAAISHYGYSSEAFCGMTVLDILPARNRGRANPFVEDENFSECKERPCRHQKADGAEIEVALYIRSMDYEGRSASLVAVTDVTARNLAETELRRTRGFLKTVIENMPTAIVVKEPREGRFILVNRAAEELFGHLRDQMLGKTDRDLFPVDKAEHILARDAEALRSDHQLVSLGLPFESPGGGLRFVNTKRFAIRDESGEPRFLVGVIEDITAHRRAENELVHLAHHDALTKLANRNLFRQRLEQALAQTQALGQRVAVFCIDLDSFKGVNDTLGHPVGDALLRLTAERLIGCVRSCDTVARLGGDEFAIIQFVEDQEQARALANRINAVIGKPFDVEGNVLSVGASVGIAMAPEDGNDPDHLLKNADMAMYRAKADGRGVYRLFEPEMNLTVRARRALEIDLRAAMSTQEFELFYQPSFDLKTKKIKGAEALLRWRHPVRGVVSPAEFIPIAEEMGLIFPLGDWVLQQACAEAMNWTSDVKVAVNLSPLQFEGHGLAASVIRALEISGLPPHRLEVEVTESLLLQENDRNIAILHQLRELGLSIALDDFGIGYSSLSYLRSFPFDKIKIDRSFVDELPSNPECLAIVRAIAKLAGDLSMQITAEGVETDAQLECLRLEQVTEVQGFLLGRPVPAREFRVSLSQPLEGAGKVA